MNGKDFATAITSILAAHRPSRMPCFVNLGRRELSTDQLATIHHLYQASMHATRAGVYLMPHLHNPALRKRKLQVFVDDDGLAGGDTHHYQLTRVFQRMGATPLFDDEAFGDESDVLAMLPEWPRTRRFVRHAFRLYARSLGPWCVVEGLSANWMRALADGLAVHAPEIVKEPYFAECFDQHVEERHADEAIEVATEVMALRPLLIPSTVLAARKIACALDGVWKDLDAVITGAR